MTPDGGDRVLIGISRVSWCWVWITKITIAIITKKKTKHNSNSKSNNDNNYSNSVSTPIVKSLFPQGLYISFLQFICNFSSIHMLLFTTIIMCPAQWCRVHGSPQISVLEKLYQWYSSIPPSQPPTIISFGLSLPVLDFSSCPMFSDASLLNI